jgi:anthranilate 1,2-dioxygenase small subunit
MIGAPSTGGPRVPEDVREAIGGMLLEYVMTLDEDRLESWPDFFVEDGQYRVLSRENVALKLPAPLMYYYSRGMMKDRVRALREALTYQPLFCRHVVSAPRIRQRGEGEILVESSFALYQTTEEGVTNLFTSGLYADVVVFNEGGAKFRSRTVTMDSFGVHNLIAVPI